MIKQQKGNNMKLLEKFKTRKLALEAYQNLWDLKYDVDIIGNSVFVEDRFFGEPIMDDSQFKTAPCTVYYK